LDGELERFGGEDGAGEQKEGDDETGCDHGVERGK
jgi:hypothetical protein